MLYIYIKKIVMSFKAFEELGEKNHKFYFVHI